VSGNSNNVSKNEILRSTYGIVIRGNGNVIIGNIMIYNTIKDIDDLGTNTLIYGNMIFGIPQYPFTVPTGNFTVTRYKPKSYNQTIEETVSEEEINEENTVNDEENTVNDEENYGEQTLISLASIVAITVISLSIITKRKIARNFDYI
jgi:parallel beta-helix repeat protein